MRNFLRFLALLLLVTQNASATVEVNPFSGGGSGDLLSTNNLSDVASASTSRTNLGAAASGANTDITSLSTICKTEGSFEFCFEGPPITANRTYTFPDASVTFPSTFVTNLQTAYQGGNTIAATATKGPVKIEANAGDNLVFPALLHIVGDDLGGDNSLFIAEDSQASARYGMYFNMPNASNNGAGIYSAYGGTAGPGVAALALEIVAGSADGLSAHLQEGITGRNLALSYGNAFSQIGISVPKSVFTSYDLTLPPDNGDAGEFLQTDGSGVSTWERPTTTLVTGTTATGSATCTASCSTGVLTGGGCNDSLALALQKSYPSSTTTWSCEYAAATGDCTAYAICI